MPGQASCGLASDDSSSCQEILSDAATANGASIHRAAVAGPKPRMRERQKGHSEGFFTSDVQILSAQEPEDSRQTAQ